MERRIAQRHVEVFIVLYHALEGMSAIALMAQLDRIAQSGIRSHDRLRCLQCILVGLRPDEAPAIVAVTH